MKQALSYKKKGLTVSKIARKLQTNRQQVYRWLSYEKKNL
jgi:transposase-like protein